LRLIFDIRKQYIDYFVFIVMPRSKVENISKSRSYKKNKPDPESSDSETQYETVSNDSDEDDDSSYYPSTSDDSSEYYLKKHKKGKR